jgi:hypothetical protein
LAQKLTNFIIYHSKYFLEDGCWHVDIASSDFEGAVDGHTHSRFATIAGIASVGVLTGNIGETSEYVPQEIVIANGFLWIDKVHLIRWPGLTITPKNRTSSPRSSC